MLRHGGNGEGGKDRGWVMPGQGWVMPGQVFQPVEFANEAGFLE